MTSQVSQPKYSKNVFDLVVLKVLSEFMETEGFSELQIQQITGVINLCYMVENDMIETRF